MHAPGRESDVEVQSVAVEGQGANLIDLEGDQAAPGLDSDLALAEKWKRVEHGAEQDAGDAAEDRSKPPDDMPADSGDGAAASQTTGAVYCSEGLKASLAQAQAAIQTLIWSVGSNLTGGSAGAVPPESMKQHLTIQNPAQFNHAMELLEQAVAMARAARVSEDMEHEANGSSFSAAADGRQPLCPGASLAELDGGSRPPVKCVDAVHAASAGENGGLKSDLAGDASHGGDTAGEGAPASEVGVRQKKETRNVLDAEGAMRIFRLKEQHRTRDDLSERLANEYSITPKAVRDIWNLRTWMNTTRPLWNAADHQRFLGKKLCEDCRAKSVQSLGDACHKCRQRPTKGRPPTKVDEDKLKKLFGFPQVDAAKELNISLATLKATCRRLGFQKWPYEKEDVANGVMVPPLPPSAPPPPAQAAEAQVQLFVESAALAASGGDGVDTVGGLKLTGNRGVGRGRGAGGKASPGKGRKRVSRVPGLAGEEDCGEASGGADSADLEEERHKKARVMEPPGGDKGRLASADASQAGMHAIHLMHSRLRQLSQQEREAMTRGNANILAVLAAMAAQEHAVAASSGVAVADVSANSAEEGDNGVSRAKMAGQKDQNRGAAVEASVLGTGVDALAAARALGLSANLDPLLIALYSGGLHAAEAADSVDGTSAGQDERPAGLANAVHVPMSAALSSALSLNAVPQFMAGRQQEAARALLALGGGGLKSTAAALLAAGNGGMGFADLGIGSGGGNGAEGEGRGTGGNGDAGEEGPNLADKGDPDEKPSDSERRRKNAQDSTSKNTGSSCRVPVAAGDTPATTDARARVEARTASESSNLRGEAVATAASATNVDVDEDGTVNVKCGGGLKGRRSAVHKAR